MTLPLALPGIVTAVIFTFIAAWNEFVIALTLTGTPDVQPLADRRRDRVHRPVRRLVAVPVRLVLGGDRAGGDPVILIEKWLVGGLTAGSVK